MTYVTPARDDSPRLREENGTRVLRLGSAANLLSPAEFVSRAFVEALRASPRPDMIWIVTDVNRRHLPLLLALRAAGIATAYVKTMAFLSGGRVDRDWKFRAVDYTVSSSEYVRNQLVERGAPARRSRVISNGVDLERFRPAVSDEKRNLRRSLSLTDDEPIALFAGLFAERKGVVELLEGYKRYRASAGRGRLIMVGDHRRYPGDQAFHERLTAALSDAGDFGVELRAATPEIESYYRAADLFVFLTRREGFGNVLLEAMATGLPVLTTRFEGFSREHGRDGVDLRLTTHDPGEVSRQLSELLGDPARAAELGARGRVWVEKNHDRELSLESWAALAREARERARSWHRGLLSGVSLGA
jgi:glycosyltransferase involved in cell wall biosynthesis